MIQLNKENIPQVLGYLSSITEIEDIEINFRDEFMLVRGPGIQSMVRFGETVDIPEDWIKAAREY